MNTYLLKRTCLLILSSCSLVLFCFFVLNPSQTQAAPTQQLETFIKSEAENLQLTLRLPSATQTANGHIEVAGLENQLTTPGQPALPYFSTLVIVPPKANITVNVASKAAKTTQLTQAVPPAPTGAYNPEVDLAPQPVWVADEAIYEENGRFPHATYDLSEPLFYHGYQLVRLNVYPLQYNPTKGELYEVSEMNLHITFSDAKWEQVQTGKKRSSAVQTTLEALALNYEQGQTWQTSSSNIASQTLLPLDKTLYKFYIDQDGIYEINYTDLQNAGMPVDSVNPQTFEMMYRGQSVAYQFVGDADTQFEAGEFIRFYGWAFSGPRTEAMHILDNVLWLWADGSPITIQTRANETGNGHPITTHTQTEYTAEQDNSYFATWTNLWHLSPNEPDAWFWDYSSIAAGAANLTMTYQVELDHVVQTGENITWTVEVQSRNYNQSYRTFKAQINGSPDVGTFSWFGLGNRNITAVVPDTDIVNGQNQVDIGVFSAVRERWYLNRITAVYQRALVATNDQLIFADPLGGNKEFHISGFSQPANQALVWDISTITQPVSITMTAAHDISDGMGNYTYTVGSTHPTSTQFIATASILTVNDLAQPIEPYTPTSLDPVGGAEWLAIAHSTLTTETQQLATHRRSPTFGGLSTHVVTIDEVINQYGYGLPLPEAIQTFVSHAYTTWTTPPSYLLLVGDATHNPRHLDCAEACVAWDETEENLVLTNLLFEDRFQGLIPSDYPYALLSGDDLLPEIAVGRIAAQTPTQAQAAIDKIILYEQNQFNPAHYDVLNNLLFIADNTDSGGNFCNENETVIDTLPNGFDTTALCYLNGVANTTDMIALMQQEINETGVSIINYRGHGSIPAWASEKFLESSDVDFWQNSDYPAIVLSADCLDGYFAWPGYEGLGETFIKQSGTGSAAHWSSTGLGYTFEHTQLHREFYNAVYELGLTDIGSAINYSKIAYYLTGFDVSELYAFTLQGDPAMQIFRPDLDVQITAVPPSEPTSQLTYQLQVHNEGIYPSQITLQDVLPIGWTAHTITPSVPVSITVTMNQTELTLHDKLARGETAVFTITTNITPPSYTGLVTNSTYISSYTGMDLDLADNQQTSLVLLGSTPSPPALAVNNTLSLVWNTAPNNCGYHAYEHTMPYFLPNEGTSFANWLNATVSSYPSGNMSSQNRFYLVTGLGCGLNGGETAVSNETGIFHFTITPGD